MVGGHASGPDQLPRCERKPAFPVSMRLKKPDGAGLLAAAAAGTRATRGLDRSEGGHVSCEPQAGLVSAAPLVIPLSDANPIPGVGTWLTDQMPRPRAERQPMLLAAVPASGRAGCCTPGTMGRARAGGFHCAPAGEAPHRAAGPHCHQGAVPTVACCDGLVEGSCWLPVGSACTHFDAS